MKKGFTLVELLAVIIILAIILAIAIPGISNIVSTLRKAAFESDAKLIIKGISYLQLNNENYNVSSINETNLKDLTGVGADNYNTLSVSKVNGEIKVIIVGKNKWDDLVAYGTSDDIKVVDSSDFTGFADNSGASEPELANNMIPIMYYNGNWVKADKDNLVDTYSWYDYTTKKWANAVTVKSSTLETYKNGEIGTTIVDEEDILTYLVWIPRYKYAIPADTEERSINIAFENSLTSKSSGTAIDTNYRTHPAFTFGEKELNGFWVGKFETTGTTNVITVKPNLESLRGQTVSTLYTAIGNMKSGGNLYSFSSNEVDTHMMKNDEWGAVAYLSKSVYGLNSEIYKNNSSSYYTGRSGGNVGGSQIKPNGTNEYIGTGFYTYDGKCATTTAIVSDKDPNNKPLDPNCTVVGNTISDKSLAYNASTTGNIYGIYDMSGGLWEYVMGNYNNYSGYSSGVNSGFNGPNGGDGSTVTGGLDFPTEQYYNKYTTSVETTACNGGICYGHALSETSGWYGDYATMVSANYPWFIRGGAYYYTANAGAFGFDDGHGYAVSNLSARVVVALRL